MFVYILLGLIIGVSALIESGKMSNQTKKLFNISLLVFLLVVGLRFRHGDYSSYEMGYYMNVDVGGDAGYFELQKFFASLALPFPVFIFIITLFSVFCFKKIYSLSPWPLFGMVMLLGKIFTLYAMSGIRQYIAMAMCWWALYELLMHQRRIRFLLMVFLAYTLHGSAVIFFPVLLFRNLKFKYSTAFIMLGVAILIGQYSVDFFSQASEMNDLINQRLGGYIEVTKSGGASMNMLNYFENIVFLVLVLLARKKAVNKIPYLDFFIYMFIIYCGFLIAGNEIGVIKRLRDYYSIAYAFIIPAIYYLYRDQKMQQLTKFIMVTYFVFLLFRSLMVYDQPFPPNYYGRMIPYHSILHMNE